MICLHTTSTSASTSATMTHAMPSHNDLILRALEREREALLAKTHAAFSYYEHSPYAELDSVVDADDDDDDDDEDDDEYECDNAPRYDTRGRQAAFRETVRQRQARLEFLRRQDAARRRVSRTRKSEEIVVASLSRSVFYPASSSSSSYSPSTSTSTSTTSDSSSDSDSDSLAELEPDSDSEDEWDAPTPRVHLYVVVDEEEEEEEEEEDDDYTFSVTAIHSRSRYEQSKPMTQPQSPPRRQIARSSPSSPRSPVARVPSLESILERPELEA